MTLTDDQQAALVRMLHRAADAYALDASAAEQLAERNNGAKHWLNVRASHADSSRAAHALAAAIDRAAAVTLADE